MMSKNEQKNTYIIDPERLEEMVRLSKQAFQFNRSLGPLLPRVDPATVSTVLDVACGPGTWVLEVATEYPHIEVIGFDISHRMVEYAQQQAAAEGLTNAHFFVGDATQRFPWDDESFDVVNARTIFAFMLRDQWPSLMHECTRLVRRHGMLHLLESESASTISTGDVYATLTNLIVRAMWQAGMGFCSSGSYFGITPMLSDFLLREGYRDIEETSYSINYSYGKSAHEPITEVFLAALPTMKDFLIRCHLATEHELDILIQQAYQASLEENFRAVWYALSVTGLKP